MTEAQRAILLFGIAAGIVAAIILVRWIIDKNLYDYNEYTGKRELERKIRTDSERLAREHEKYKESKRVSQLSNLKA
ncbi:MAG: hypothetical protein J6V80_07150 [Clostridia bacterium]|nr:hypothetical protein [Clostridia bacterium]